MASSVHNQHKGSKMTDEAENTFIITDRQLSDLHDHLDNHATVVSTKGGRIRLMLDDDSLVDFDLEPHKAA